LRFGKGKIKSDTVKQRCVIDHLAPNEVLDTDGEHKRKHAGDEANGQRDQPLDNDLLGLQ
jgi:hypothetical protein